VIKHFNRKHILRHTWSSIQDKKISGVISVTSHLHVKVIENSMNISTRKRNHSNVKNVAEFSTNYRIINVTC